MSSALGGALGRPGVLGVPGADQHLPVGDSLTIHPNEPLARYSIVGIGGPADFLVIARSQDALLNAVQMACRAGLPWRVWGGLTNVLLPDAGIRGIVILNQARAFSLSAKTGRLYATSGVLIAPLAREMVRQGWGGLTWAVGLPGTVGGAVVNNAGAFGGEIATTLVEAEMLSPEAFAPNGGQVRSAVCPSVHRASPDWFEFRYRSSRLKGAGAGNPSGRNEIVLSAVFQLRARDPSHLAERATAYNKRRKRAQPSGRTLGSTFKNPPGDYAGRLIEAAGLKGACVGGVGVSTHHANFFINEGGGTAADFRALIDLVREEVRKRFGVDLEPEIEIVEGE